jgi:hypothetical protein
MTKGIDNSELIDRYLRDEMRGEEREVFMRRLENDPVFKLEFETQKLLAEGIRLARKQELKKFIAEKTRTRSVLLSTSKVYLLAAAASIVALAFFWVTFRYFNEQRQSFLAKEKQAPQDKTATLPETAKPEVAGGQSNGGGELAVNKTVKPTVEPAPPLEEFPSDLQLQDRAASVESAYEVSGNQNADHPNTGKSDRTSEPRIVARVTVAMADFTPQAVIVRDDAENLRESEVVRSQTDKELRRKVERSTQTPVPASQPEILTDRVSIKQPQDQYTLVFMVSADEQARAIVKAGNQLEIYNIAFGNPMLIKLNQRHFIASAGKYYSIAMNNNSAQVLQPVSDPQVLKQLNGE